MPISLDDCKEGADEFEKIWSQAIPENSAALAGLAAGAITPAGATPPESADIHHCRMSSDARRIEVPRSCP